jgi:hypothetical protein
MVTAALTRARLIRVPLWELLDPREHGPAMAWSAALALVAAVVVRAIGWPLWQASALAIGLMVPVFCAKWLADRRRFGGTVTVLGILVVLQGFHGLEHVVQWIQYHILRWPSFISSGLISAANAEWVHFVWNWAVAATVAWLLWRGVRNRWMWALLAWALAHGAEHTYMMVRYLQVLEEFRALGVSGVSAQGLPGFFGRDGWLATSPLTQDTFLCRAPGVTTAVRLDVHFWWNIGETTLLLMAAHVRMRCAGAPPA